MSPATSVDRSVPEPAANAVDGLGMAGRQVVVDDDVVAGGGQRLDGVAADVAGAARHEHDAHGRPIDE